MLKQEFENLIGAEVSQKDYDLIEFVYTWHPSIRDKQHCADLYKVGGLWIFRDMEARAADAEDLDDKLGAINKQIAKLEEQKRDLIEADRLRWEVR